MRLYFADKYYGDRIKSLYGLITDNVMDDWKENDEILINENQYLGTFLKSFGKAPKWTNDELKMFIQSFNDVGIKIYKLPSKKMLKILENSKYYISLFNL